MFSLTKPSPDALSRLVAQQSDRELTYAEHGATAGDMPPGYHHDEWEDDLGAFSQAQFDRLADALRNWRVQSGSGLAIFPAEPVRPGLTFALWFRLPGAYATATGRVVYVTSEPDRAGFAYGTLPAHPETGEEAFHLVRNGDRLLFRVRAFSRPRHPLARLGAPVSRVLQRRMNQAYLKAMREAAR
ncbi:MAG TPA: DUF1990 domain-containing protein [Streptosporangiaceae bacterium]|nr:DUF1990 domain-containing protein [Streptosporangiaceae bacterium]